MSIKKAKVTFSRFGLHSAVQNKVVYLPELNITYKDKLKSKGCFLLDAKKVTKKSYKACGYGDDFIVLYVDKEYLIYSELGDLLSTLSDEIGQLIVVNNDHFIVRIENSIFGFDKNGNEIGGRKLTGEEIAMLNVDK